MNLSAQISDTAKGRRVLSLEDNPDTTAGVADDLRELGFEVVEVRTADAAGQYLQLNRQDLLLVDLVLPWRQSEDGGREFIRALKTGSFGLLNADIPFVVLTAYPYRDIEPFLAYQGFLGAIAKTLPVVSELAALGRGRLDWFPEDVRIAQPAYVVDDILIFDAGSDDRGYVHPIVSAWPFGDRVPILLEDQPEELQAALEFREFPVLAWAKVNIDAEKAVGVLPHDIHVIWERHDDINE